MAAPTRGKEAVGRGFTKLGTFSGRDPRGTFWPYAGVVLVTTFVVGNALTAPVVVLSAVRPSTDPASTMLAMLVAVGSLTLVIAVLLAAAVTRRLHDRGLRGGWALAPLVALVTGLAMMALIPRAAERGDDPTLFFLVGFGIDLVYFALLGAPVVQLVLPGQPRDNRFGPG